MIRFRSLRAVGAISLLALGLGATQACTTSSGRTIGGTAGSSSAGSSGSAGATSGSAGSGTAGEGTAGASAGGSGSAGATIGTAGAAGGSTGGAGTAGAGSAGTTGNDASVDSASPPFDAAGRTPPTCKTNVPSPIPAMKPTSECDFLLQSLDFEDMYNYTSPQIEITSYGSALGAYEINKCMPYCYAKALTIGVDIVGGGAATALQGEVIVHFPATGPELPIATAVGRDQLAWIQLSGDTAPPFKIMAQLVLESSTAGIIPAKNMVQVGYNDWLGDQNAEVKYFGIGAAPGGPFATDPVNIVGMGFRIFAPAGLAKGMEWHGLLIIDHMEIRKGGEDMPAGSYPYGLN